MVESETCCQRVGLKRGQTSEFLGTTHGSVHGLAHLFDELDGGSGLPLGVFRENALPGEEDGLGKGVEGRTLNTIASAILY